MPTASVSQRRFSRSAGARSKTRGDRTVRTGRTNTDARIRWDRLGRVAMLFVGAALVYLYLSAGIHMLSTWRQARRDSATVVAMEREHTLLERQHEALGTGETLEQEARQLGMIKKGEQSYIVSGLPNN